MRRAERRLPAGQRTASLLAVGLLGGTCLGIVARVWMRFVSDDPEFSWPGTLGIVAGFAFFGVTQVVVSAARRAAMPRRGLTGLRVVGVIGMLPLFGAAGAVMAPTVVGAGLAVSRDDWPRLARAVCAAIAIAPVVFVAADFSGSFGWSIRTLAGIIALIAIYAAITWAAQATLAPQRDGWRIPSWAKIVIPLAVIVLVAIPLYVGGIS